MPATLHAQTGSFDVYKSTSDSIPGISAQSEFLLKIHRTSSSNFNANAQALLLNAKAQWSQLQVEAPVGVYIVALIPTPTGIATSYYERGDILQYYLRNPTINILPVLIECARTLAYLHTKGVVHGNICTRNFLIDSSTHAHMSDIGIHESLRIDNFTTAWRYLPFTEEYMEDQRLNITAIHDVHAFGMMMYELYAKQKPFPHLKDRPQTLPRIAMGLPNLTRPLNMPNQIWKLMQDCISNDTPRPTMHDVEQRLIAIFNEGIDIVENNT